MLSSALFFLFFTFSAMNKKYLGVVTAGLLALAALIKISAAAQGVPRGKVSASLLNLT